MVRRRLPHVGTSGLVQAQMQTKMQVQMLPAGGPLASHARAALAMLQHSPSQHEAVSPEGGGPVPREEDERGLWHVDGALRHAIQPARLHCS